MVVAGGLGRSREGVTANEESTRSVLIGRARRVLLVGVPAVGLAVAMVGVAPAQQAFAQESSGGSINIGASIAATVASAVSGIASQQQRRHHHWW